MTNLETAVASRKALDKWEKGARDKFLKEKEKRSAKHIPLRELLTKAELDKYWRLTDRQ